MKTKIKNRQAFLRKDYQGFWKFLNIFRMYYKMPILNKITGEVTVFTVYDITFLSAYLLLDRYIKEHLKDFQ